MSLRQSSSGMGRGKKRGLKKKKKVNVKPLTGPEFFEEWLPEDDDVIITDGDNQREEDHETTQDQAKRRQAKITRDKLRQRLLLTYKILKKKAALYQEEHKTEIETTTTQEDGKEADRNSCPLLTRHVKSMQDLVEQAVAVYRSSCSRTSRLCGDKYSCPCVMLLGGEVACAEISRLHSRCYNFDKDSAWLQDQDLSDLDSTLCMVVNKLAAVSQREVHCWWNAPDFLFVVFVECSVVVVRSEDSGD